MDRKNHLANITNDSLSFIDLSEQKEESSESGHIELSVAEMNEWLTRVFRSVSSREAVHLDTDCLSEDKKILIASLEDKKLMLMPAAHDYVDVSLAYISGALPLAEILKKIPRDHLDNLTCIIPLLESNKRHHWVLLMLHENTWHFFDPKKKLPRNYSLEPIRKAIEACEGLASFVNAHKSFSFIPITKENIHYTGMQKIKNKSHSAYFVVYYAEQICNAFYAHKTRVEMVSFEKISQHNARIVYLYDCYLKEMDAIEAHFDNINKIEILCNRVSNDAELADTYKKILTSFLVRKLYQAINSQHPLPVDTEEKINNVVHDASTPPEEEKSIVFDEVVIVEQSQDHSLQTVKDSLAHIQTAIGGINDERCRVARSHCKKILDEMWIAHHHRTRKDEKLLEECKALYEIAIALQHPEADNFVAIIKPHVQQLMQDDPLRPPLWKKLGFALLGIIGGVLAALGVAAIFPGVAAASGAFLIAAGGASICTGTVAVAYSGYGLFSKTSRDSLQCAVSGIQAPVLHTPR